MLIRTWPQLSLVLQLCAGSLVALLAPACTPNQAKQIEVETKQPAVPPSRRTEQPTDAALVDPDAPTGGDNLSPLQNGSLDALTRQAPGPVGIGGGSNAPSTTAQVDAQAFQPYLSGWDAASFQGNVDWLLSP
jgi:hypothetical protein